MTQGKAVFFAQLLGRVQSHQDTKAVKRAKQNLLDSPALQKELLDTNPRF